MQVQMNRVAAGSPGRLNFRPPDCGWDKTGPAEDRSVLSLTLPAFLELPCRVAGLLRGILSPDHYPPRCQDQRRGPRLSSLAIFRIRREFRFEELAAID